MPVDIVATARRSSLVSTFGVGSLLPAQDDSVIICGIEEWPQGEVLVEPRLTQSLGVRELRSPSTWRGTRGDVPAVRFPEWAFCTECRVLGPGWSITRDVRGKRICRSCGSKAVSPSRFVCCCTKGHIEDFPYRAWAHESGATPAADHDLKLVSRGHSSALSDLIVECSCGVKRSLDGAFQGFAFRGIHRCSGARPWLVDAEPQPCDEPPRALQRGSSNVWFAAVRSAISIPSVKERARAFAEQTFRTARPERPAAELAAGFDPPPGCTVEDVAAAIEEMRTPAASQERLSESELRAQEYRALVNGLADEDDDAQEEARRQFVCVEQEISGAGLPELIKQVSRVSRLREVRALQGFTRITPATTEADIIPVSIESPAPWLPAIEVMGEGVFVRLDEALLSRFLESEFGRARYTQHVTSHLNATANRDAQREFSARLVVVHSLAHILLNELSLTAGYPAASLRERVYAEDGQAGILIYTATADSAGSLGGLAALSEPSRLAAVLSSAVSRAQWCTSDPVCIESPSSGVDGLNLAACHACMLLPETSCEHFNCLLDRALIVGTQESPEFGLIASKIS